MRPGGRKILHEGSLQLSKGSNDQLHIRILYFSNIYIKSKLAFVNI